MFHKTKINKNIIKRETARNYCNEELIMMDGIWLMKGYPEPNKALQKTLKTMGNIVEIEKVIKEILDKKFDSLLQYTPITFKGARALYKLDTKEYVFVNDDYLEMINLEECNIIGTDNVYGPIIFESKTNTDQWLLIMPMRVIGANEWLKNP